MEQKFAKQGWLIGYQLPYCTTTINDAYIFPVLSKIVYRSQAINFKGMTLSTEDLRALAKEAFETYPFEKHLMAFVQNEQLAHAVLED